VPGSDLVCGGLFVPEFESESAALTRAPAPGDLPALPAPSWVDARWESQSLQLFGRQR